MNKLQSAGIIFISCALLLAITEPGAKVLTVILFVLGAIFVYGGADERTE